MTSAMTLNRPRRWALALGVPFALALIAYGGLTYVGLVGQDNFRVHAQQSPRSGQGHRGRG